MFNSGQSFAHFKIIKKLGEGGMGEVYLAEDQKLNRNVALKILRPDFIDDPDRLQRLNREARTAAQISHPNVMSIFDVDSAVDEDSGRDMRYIVMEYISGISLSDYLRTRRPTLPDSLRIAEKIASGLAAAHKLDIVHRDIKTDNIRIDDEGQPRILDFGLAKPLETGLTGGDDDATDSISQDLTQEGKIMGTVNYMSPEQARGETVDARSDVFSFGILLYLMITGELPFSGPEKVSTLARILETRQKPLREHDESIPHELERIVDKCLQKDPDNRYQNTRDLVIDIRSLRRQYESSISESVSSISGVTDKASGKKTSKSIITTLGIPIAVVIVGLLVILLRPVLMGPGAHSPGRFPSGLHAHENALAIFGFENKTGDSTLDWLQSGLPEILLTDLAQGSKMDIISRNRVLDCLDDKITNLDQVGAHKECVDAARSLGASTVLSGSFYKMGEMIRIDARLEDVESGKIITGEKVIGADPFVLVDSLTQKIAHSLNIKEMFAADRHVSEFTSSSPEAFRYYMHGMEKFSIGMHEAAIEFFEKAIDIDSTFALPYMRIGMSYAFLNRGNKGSPYFAMAKKYENKLPIKEKSLLDIYYDIWFNSNFDDAIAKMDSFVGNYPDDKEGRAIYGQLKFVLRRDTTAAIAQLDTVMMLDDRFALGLLSYAELYGVMEKYDSSIYFGEKLIEYYPESPAGYLWLTRLYYGITRYDDALRTGKEYLEIAPDDSDIINLLINVAILKRNFELAAEYNEKLNETHANNPYIMTDYHQNKARLSVWGAKIEGAAKHLYQGLDIALNSGDSALIFEQYSLLGDYYEALGLDDSALHYNAESYKWATKFQNLGYPMYMAGHHPELADSARVIFDAALRNFKSKLPSELWPLTDQLQREFDGLIAHDTTMIIDALRNMIEEQQQAVGSNKYSLGRYMVLYGQYEEAKKYLEPVKSGEDATTNPVRYLRTLYYLGRAHEGLGETAEALSNYEEILKYWGGADLEIEEVADTRQRLDRLRS